MLTPNGQKFGGYLEHGPSPRRPHPDLRHHMHQVFILPQELRFGTPTLPLSRKPEMLVWLSGIDYLGGSPAMTSAHLLGSGLCTLIWQWLFCGWGRRWLFGGWWRLFSGCSVVGGGCSAVGGGCSVVGGGCSVVGGGCSVVGGGCSVVDGGCSVVGGGSAVVVRWLMVVSVLVDCDLSSHCLVTCS